MEGRSRSRNQGPTTDTLMGVCPSRPRRERPPLTAHTVLCNLHQAAVGPSHRTSQHTHTNQNMNLLKLRSCLSCQWNLMCFKELFASQAMRSHYRPQRKAKAYNDGLAFLCVLVCVSKGNHIYI